jgi:hypothetical protein
MKKRVKMRKQIEREEDRLARRLGSSTHFPESLEGFGLDVRRDPCRCQRKHVVVLPQSTLDDNGSESQCVQAQSDGKTGSERVDAFRVQPKEFVMRQESVFWKENCTAVSFNNGIIVDRRAVGNRRKMLHDHLIFLRLTMHFSRSFCWGTHEMNAPFEACVS